MAGISYKKTEWKNNVTPLNEENMNHIENGIESLDKAIENLDNVLTPEMFGAVGDGSTDDTAALQAMIDAEPTSNGKVFLFTSVKGYRVRNILSIHNKHHLTFAHANLIFGDSSESRLEACMKINGGSSNISFENCSFRYGSQVIYLWDCENIRVSHCTFDGCGYCVIQQLGYASDNVFVTDNLAKNCVQDFVECNCEVDAPSKNWTVTGNIYVRDEKPVAPMKTECRFLGATAIRNMIISNNIIENVRGDSCISMEDPYGEIVIDGNTFTDCIGTGYIQIIHGDKNTIVSNNHFVNTIADNGTPFIYLYDSGSASPYTKEFSVIVEGNLFNGNGTQTNPLVNIDYTSYPFIIKNNVFRNIGVMFDHVGGQNISFDGNDVMCKTFFLVDTSKAGYTTNSTFSNNRIVGDITITNDYNGNYCSGLSFTGNYLDGTVSITNAKYVLFAGNTFTKKSVFTFDVKGYYSEHMERYGNFQVEVGLLEPRVSGEIDIVQEPGNSPTAVMSQKATTDEMNTIKGDLASKASTNYVDENKIDKNSIVQEPGSSQTAVMSQKATTDEIDAVKGDLEQLTASNQERFENLNIENRLYTETFANDIESLTNTPGHYWDVNNYAEAADGWNYYTKTVIAGEIYKIKTWTASNARAFYFVDSKGDIIQAVPADPTSDIVEKRVLVPRDAVTMIVNAKPSVTEIVFEKIVKREYKSDGVLEGQIAKNKKGIDDIISGAELVKSYKSVLLDCEKVEGAYFADYGYTTAVEVSNLWNYYRKEVKPGEKYHVVASATQNVAACTIFDADENIVAYYPNPGVTALTTHECEIDIPENGAYMLVNHRIAMQIAIDEVVYTAYHRAKTELTGKMLAHVGDSITEAWNPDGGYFENYAELAAKRNGMRIYKDGISGSTMTNIGNSKSFSESRYQNVPEYDYLLIWFGWNDAAYATLGTIDDTDNTTFYGAYKMVVDYFIRKYPTKKIGLIVPYGNFPNYQQAVRDVSAMYGVPCLDLPNGNECSLIWGMENEAQLARRAALTYDGTHPNQAGYEYLSTMVEAFLKRL